ncbi:hypothetical protein F2Q68_00012363 [Brassica cretica]|uniref:Uncharacterized protein n=1 Tax=Brassica cretica TaxID=69181 RepID=A0A8S9KN90_BRACR|nr:hypothetical protein F2Q68_00012363 [Brassica cretica]
MVHFSVVPLFCFFFSLIWIVLGLFWFRSVRLSRRGRQGRWLCSPFAELSLGKGVLVLQWGDSGLFGCYSGSVGVPMPIYPLMEGFQCMYLFFPREEIVESLFPCDVVSPVVPQLRHWGSLSSDE